MPFIIIVPAYKKNNNIIYRVAYLPAKYNAITDDCVIVISPEKKQNKTVQLFINNVYYKFIEMIEHIRNS